MNAEYPTTRTSTHALAIVSLILSLLGFTPILPLIGSIGGIITGMIARKEIRANPEKHTGDGIALSAIILGWLGIALVLLGVIAVILFLVPLSITSVRVDSLPMPMPVETYSVPVPVP
ncbi:MAG: DUF4190 domain-containing protein [Anaerolineales bacterium]|nr:DUF4190 domain-containing protein [Anaerolineales bacterium]